MQLHTLFGVFSLSARKSSNDMSSSVMSASKLGELATWRRLGFGTLGRV